MCWLRTSHSPPEHSTVLLLLQIHSPARPLFPVVLIHFFGGAARAARHFTLRSFPISFRLFKPMNFCLALLRPSLVVTPIVILPTRNNSSALD
jgi:hypothetical protein